MKIGLITYGNIRQLRELLPTDGKDWIKTKSKSVHAYMSIKKYIEQFPNIKVTLLNPRTMTITDIDKQDIVFNIFFDEVSAFEYMPNRLKPLKNLLQHKKMYPPYKFVGLIKYKDNYYNYLKKKKIPIVPFISVRGNVTELHKQRLIKFIKTYKNVFVKPLLGQEGFDVSTFFNNDYKGLIKYVIKLNKKYEGVVVQKFIPNFLEYKTFFVGGKFIFSVTVIERQDNFNKKCPPDVLSLAKRVQRSILPLFTFNNKKQAPLLLRIDIGCCNNGKKFLNEIEFGPSWYRKTTLDIPISNQMIKVAKITN